MADITASAGVKGHHLEGAQDVAASPQRDQGDGLAQGALEQGPVRAFDLFRLADQLEVSGDLPGGQAGDGRPVAGSREGHAPGEAFAHPDFLGFHGGLHLELTDRAQKRLGRRGQGPDAKQARRALDGPGFGDRPLILLHVHHPGLQPHDLAGRLHGRQARRQGHGPGLELDHRPGRARGRRRAQGRRPPGLGGQGRGLPCELTLQIAERAPVHGPGQGEVEDFPGPQRLVRRLEGAGHRLGLSRQGEAGG